jgi:hypothetical protein
MVRSSTVHANAVCHIELLLQGHVCIFGSYYVRVLHLWLNVCLHAWPAATA